jgi:peptide/nickel transport system ATP-binding protein
MYLGQMVEWGDAEALYDDPQHPYTTSLLNAIPLPDPSRRGRDRKLPHGEIPDALSPPAGCRFHPRCPAAFEPCGWQGKDLIDAFEDRWTQVDEPTFERELALIGGDLSAAEVGLDEVRFPAADAPGLRRWLDEVAPHLPVPVSEGIASVEPDGDDVVVRFKPRVEPAVQTVAGRQVSCHLHGVVSRT